MRENPGAGGAEGMMHVDAGEIGRNLGKQVKRVPGGLLADDNVFIVRCKLLAKGGVDDRHGKARDYEGEECADLVVLQAKTFVEPTQHLDERDSTAACIDACVCNTSAAACKGESWPSIA